MSNKKEWVLYILECSDGTYYTGITKDINRRVKQHNKGVGSKYTSTRTPIKLIACSNKEYTHSEALKKEYYIKKQSRDKKVKIVKES